MAVSRQREYLADASSVEFTRNPRALMRALEHLATIERRSRTRRGHRTPVHHQPAGRGEDGRQRRMARQPALDPSAAGRESNACARWLVRRPRARRPAARRGSRASHPHESLTPIFFASTRRASLDAWQTTKRSHVFSNRSSAASRASTAWPRSCWAGRRPAAPPIATPISTWASTTNPTSRFRSTS